MTSLYSSSSAELFFFFLNLVLQAYTTEQWKLVSETLTGVLYCSRGMIANPRTPYRYIVSLVRNSNFASINKMYCLSFGNGGKHLLGKDTYGVANIACVPDRNCGLEHRIGK